MIDGIGVARSRYFDMTTAGDNVNEVPDGGCNTLNSLAGPPPPTRQLELHRIRQVRLREGAELRAVARRMGTKTRERLQREEDPCTDLKLSDLRRWQRALSVPLTELLIDDDRPLSAAVRERAKMLRVMKTVMAIHGGASSEAVRRMAESMMTELRHVMPELTDVAPWHGRESVRLRDYGRVVEHTVSDGFFTSPPGQPE